MGGERYTKIARGVTVRQFKSGNKVYQIQFAYKSVSCREAIKIPITKANDRYVTNLRAEIENAIVLGTFNYPDYFPESSRAAMFGHSVSKETVEDLLIIWLNDIERSHPSTTYRSYSKSVKRLLPELGKLRINDLSKNPEPIKRWIRGRNVTLKTIRNDMTPLRAIFDQALMENKVQQNPLDRIKVSKLVNRKNKSDYKVDPYSLDEILTLLNSADKHRPEWRPYWQFIFFTGLRTSEGYALQWGKIDWRRNEILIDCAVVERQLKEVKTQASEAVIDILPMALEALKDQRKYTQAWCDYVFINPRTKKPILDYEETAAVLQYLCKKTGVRYRMQRQTRHTFASNMLSGGENPYRVATLLRHANVEMVFKVYGKWIEQGKKDQKKIYLSEFANISKKAREKHVNTEGK